MAFTNMLNDLITVVKPDGTRIDKVRASVQSKKVFVQGIEPVIEPGDLLVRKMSNGAVETMRVIDPGFHERFGGIPAGYQITYEKLGLPEGKQAAQSITYQVNGNNARINHHSVDYSTNIVQERDDAAQLLKVLRQELDRIDLSPQEKQDAIEIVDEVQEQFAGKTPKRSVVKSLLSALPDAAAVAEAVTALIELAK